MMRKSNLVLFLVASMLIIAGCGGGKTCTKGERGCVDNSVAFCSQGQWVTEKNCDDSNQICKDAECTGENYPPIVSLGSDLEGNVGDTIFLSAEISDLDGDQLTFEWRVVSAPIRDVEYDDIDTLEPWFKFSVKGVYVVMLTVKDDVTRSSDNISIRVY